MKVAYYGSRISDHLVRTEEGYLICKDVPIARTGVQEYRGEEFGGPEPGRVYKVTRPEDEVFDKAAMASFEGKPLVDEHPPDDVTADNYAQYMKGVCRDVRRGDGALSGMLVADLIIYDKALGAEVETGQKRDISCGYDCFWEPSGPGAYTQRHIRGNHIAVTIRGRAGRAVGIRDSDVKGGTKTMKTKSGLWGRMLRALALDTETKPEDLAAAAKLAPSEEGAEDSNMPQGLPAPAPAFDAEKAFGELSERMKGIEDSLAALRGGDHGEEDEEPEPDQEPEDRDVLDSLAEELRNGKAAGANDEGEVEATPEDINKAHGGEGEDDDDVIEPDDAGEDDDKVRDAALDCIEAMKPVIAALPPKQRKRAADSLAALIRGNVHDSGYAAIARMRQQRAKEAQQARDSEDLRELGRDWAKKYNPHFKEN